MTTRAFTSILIQSLRPVPKRSILISTVLAALILPATAASLKGVMGEMSDSTKAARALLTSFDPAEADALFARLAESARSADALYARREDAESKDLRSRFLRLASMAASSVGQSRDAVNFRGRISAIVGECRSCHSAYK